MMDLMTVEADQGFLSALGLRLPLLRAAHVQRRYRARLIKRGNDGSSLDLGLNTGIQPASAPKHNQVDFYQPQKGSGVLPPNNPNDCHG
jgi:hypothetical protein